MNDVFKEAFSEELGKIARIPIKGIAKGIGIALHTYLADPFFSGISGGVGGGVSAALMHRFEQLRRERERKKKDKA